MSKNRYIICLSLLFFALCASAQKAERNYIRKGNRAFKDSAFVKADVNYRKALQQNGKSAVSMYNLGNALTQQKKYNEALQQYQKAAKIEKDKSHLASIYHNMGVLFLGAKDYENAVKACKMSLLNNPNDEETRYNLALAQKMLKKNPQNKDKNKNKNKQNKDKQKNKQDKDKQKQDKNKQDQNKNKDQNKQNQQKQQQKQNQNQMSKQNADQLLNAVMQEEKGTQNKMKNRQGLRGNRLEKNW